jgi:hypothetical protein
MAGAAKRRAPHQNRGGSSGPPSSGGRSTQGTRSSDRSTPHSIGGKYDGPKDARPPQEKVVTNVANLRNFEMSFSMWDAARGVSLPAFSLFIYPFIHPVLSYAPPICRVVMHASFLILKLLFLPSIINYCVASLNLSTPSCTHPTLPLPTFTQIHQFSKLPQCLCLQPTSLLPFAPSASKLVASSSAATIVGITHFLGPEYPHTSLISIC